LNVKGRKGKWKGLNANVDDWRKRVLLALLEAARSVDNNVGTARLSELWSERWASRIETLGGEKKYVWRLEFGRSIK
jgi:hypothetical protein